MLSGTVIPGVLISGMNSDLPGTILGQVARDVYDTVTGEYLLIPRGTKLIGIYDTDTAFAQTRGAVIWQRMVLPNGDSMVLQEVIRKVIQGLRIKKEAIMQEWCGLLFLVQLQ